MPPAGKPRGRPRKKHKSSDVEEQEEQITAYEERRNRNVLINNEKMKGLGITQLTSLLATSTITPQKTKHSRKDDSGSEYNGDEDATNDEDLSDDSLTPERAISGKKRSANNRVAARAQTPNNELCRVTRSKKNYGPKVVCPTSEMRSEAPAEPPVVTLEKPATTNRIHEQEVDAEQNSHVDHNHQESGINDIAIDNPVVNDGPHSNDSDAATNSEDVEIVEEDVCTRGASMGKILDKMSRKGRLPPVIEEGRIRPMSSVMASKFATECSIAVKNQVPIFYHWKESKKRPNLVKDFIAKVGSRFQMDTTAAPIKKACTEMMKKAIKQHRHRLKKRYFDPYPIHLVTKVSPVKSMNDGDWNKLVEFWKEKKSMDISEKNRENRSQVQFHQRTGSRSYDSHIETLKAKYKDDPPNALDLFKECHFSKKKGFSPTVLSAIAEMESKINEPPQEGEEPKSVDQVFLTFLLQRQRGITSCVMSGSVAHLVHVVLINSVSLQRNLKWKGRPQMSFESL